MASPYDLCEGCGQQHIHCECEIQFADPGGNSALRREHKGNPRIHPCPTCHQPNRLTPEDVSLGYQCDRCADRQEHGREY